MAPAKTAQKPAAPKAAGKKATSTGVKKATAKAPAAKKPATKKVSTLYLFSTALYPCIAFNAFLVISSSSTDTFKSAPQKATTTTAKAPAASKAAPRKVCTSFNVF